MFGKTRKGFSFFSLAVSAVGATPVKSRTGADTSEYTAEDTSTGPTGSVLEGGAACTEIVPPTMNTTSNITETIFLLNILTPHMTKDLASYALHLSWGMVYNFYGNAPPQ